MEKQIIWIEIDVILRNFDEKLSSVIDNDW